jgi:hypothetical protein
MIHRIPWNRLVDLATGQDRPAALRLPTRSKGATSPHFSLRQHSRRVSLYACQSSHKRVCLRFFTGFKSNLAHPQANMNCPKILITVRLETGATTYTLAMFLGSPLPGPTNLY